jgi:hypothetical protein
MGINKHFVRWYDGKSSIKERNERDKWQLIRDLTEEEMEECKKDEYGFLKKIKGKDIIAAIKVLKIGKVWKILIYLANKSTMEKVFENALKRGIFWSFHQFKRPFKGKTIEEEGSSVKNHKRSRERMPSPKDRESRNVILEMLPQRIFPELTGIAQYQREKRAAAKIDQVKEQEVVEIIDKYRKDLLEEEVNTSLKSSLLKKDNVSPSEVVDIIKEQRNQDKMERFYQKGSWPIKNPLVKDKVNECLSPKLDEIKMIFEKNESAMEWKKIVDKMAKAEAKACG